MPETKSAGRYSILRNGHEWLVLHIEAQWEKMPDIEISIRIVATSDTHYKAEKVRYALETMEPVEKLDFTEEPTRKLPPLPVPPLEPGDWEQAGEAGELLKRHFDRVSQEHRRIGRELLQAAEEASMIMGPPGGPPDSPMPERIPEI